MDILGRITVKTINYRGGYTISRYTVTCECGCEDVPGIQYWPSKKALAESTIKKKIAASINQVKQ